jgi:hypothetical protein
MPTPDDNDPPDNNPAPDNPPGDDGGGERRPVDEPHRPHTPTGDHGAGPDSGPATRPGSRRRRWLVRAVPAVSCAAVFCVVVSVVAIPGAPEDDHQQRPPSTASTMKRQSPTPPSTSETIDPAPYTGPPRWTVAVPASVKDPGRTRIAVTASGYVLRTSEEILGIDRAGKQRWRFGLPAVKDRALRLLEPTVRVTPTVVIVGYDIRYDNPATDPRPGRDILTRVDAATGRVLGRDSQASSWWASSTTLYLSICRSHQSGHLGDCYLSARDPLTNQPHWTVPTHVGAEVYNDGAVIWETTNVATAAPPPYLLVGVYPDGPASWHVSTHDPDSGQTLGTAYKEPGTNPSSDIATDQTILAIDADRTPTRGCRAVLTGYTVRDATQVWRRRVRTIPPVDRPFCTPLPKSINQRRMGVTTHQGAPSVLHLDTGELEWSAPPRGHAIAASATTLLALENPGPTGHGGQLVAYRVGTSTPLWRAPFHGRHDRSTVIITDTTIVIGSVGGDAVRYDLRSGDLTRYQGRVDHLSPTMLVICHARQCAGHAIT